MITYLQEETIEIVAGGKKLFFLPKLVGPSHNPTGSKNIQLVQNTVVDGDHVLQNTTYFRMY